MNKDIEDFYSNYSHKIRLIIDDLTGIIFEEFPNVKEKIKLEKLFYVDVDKGKFIEIKANYDYVKIVFLKLKIEIIYRNSNDIDFEKLRFLLRK